VLRDKYGVERKMNKKVDTGISGVHIYFKCQHCGKYNEAIVRFDDEDIVLKDEGAVDWDESIFEG